jgi:hypothetical protein
MIMVNPEAALNILVKDKFTPLKQGESKLIIRNFNELNELSLYPGKELELEGYITYASNIRGKDADIHFNLSVQPNDDKNFIVCEIQNADNDKHGKPLKTAWNSQQKVKVTGVLRIFLEHIYETINQPHLPHIFEIHPLRSVTIDGNDLPDITMDCPDHENFRANKSVHKVELQDDGTMTKDGRDLNDNIEIEYDGRNLIVINPPHLNVNYVYTSAYFSKNQNGSFDDSKPYVFELKKSMNPNSIGIKSVVLPGTPAYDIAKKFQIDQPKNILTVALLRSLDIGELMKSNYKIIFCPTYRLEEDGRE